MKKIIVSMMLGAAMIFGSSIYAQTDTTTGATAQQEQTSKAKEGKGDKKGGKKGNKKFDGKKPGKKMEGRKFNPFNGIQLTDDQQARLQELQRGLGPVELDSAKQANIPVNPNLTPEEKAQLRSQREAKKLEAKKNYLNGVKEVLQPEQYVIFLENCYLYAPQNTGKSALKGKHGDKARKGHGDKDKRGDKPGRKADKPVVTPQPQAQ